MWRDRTKEISDRPAVAKATWWSVAVLLSLLHLFINGLNIGNPELWLDESSTYGVAVHSLLRVLTLPTEFHSQPPLYYVILHFLIKISDARWFMRGFSWLMCLLLLQFVLFFLDELTLAARVLFCLLFIYADLTRYLASALRPYGLTALLTFVSSVFFLRMARDPSRRRAVAYAVSALAMLYTLAFDIWVAVAHGCCLAVLMGWCACKAGLRPTLRRYRASIIAISVCAFGYLPYLWLAIHWHYEPNPHHTIQYLWQLSHYTDLTREHFGFSPAVMLMLYGLIVLGLWAELRARNSLILMWLLIAVGQVGFVMVFMVGRNSLGPASRYMTPAFPSLCLLAAVGFQHLFDDTDRAAWHLAPIALAMLVGQRVAPFRDYLRAPRPIGEWGRLHQAIAKRGGKAVVFFDIGYAGQDFEYVIRKDPNITTATMRGIGTASGGDNHLDPAYIRNIISNSHTVTRCYYYWGGAVRGSYGQVFLPEMRQLGYAEVPAIGNVHGFCK